jgi:chromosome partitioning protein
VKIISILCQKGGVGKTTAAVNISSLLSDMGYKTLLIDLDPQGNVATYLNQEKNNLNKTTSIDLLEGVEEINPLIVSEKLNLIASNETISKLNQEKIIGGSKLKKIRNSLYFQNFDYIIIDTPPTMSSLVQEALATSDFYIIPAKPEFLAVEGVAQAMKFATKTISQFPSSNPIFLGVLLNQVDTRRSSYIDFLNELKYLLSDKLFESHISQSTEIADSPFYAKTVSEFSENSKARKEYLDLVNEILSKISV